MPPRLVEGPLLLWEKVSAASGNRLGKLLPWGIKGKKEGALPRQTVCGGLAARGLGARRHANRWLGSDRGLETENSNFPGQSTCILGLDPSVESRSQLLEVEPG